MNAFLTAYLEAIVFTDMSDLEDEARDCDFSTDMLSKAEADCLAFETEASEPLAKAYERGFSIEQAGNDFWLTRNGHGAGFWDREQLTDESLGDQLSAIAHNYGECDVYAGDDGLAYLS